MRPQVAKDPQMVALIHAVHHNAVIYNYRLPGYNNERYKYDVWKSIAKAAKMQNAEEARRCWNKLHQSFTVFYRNELIRLVLSNYDEDVVGPLREAISHDYNKRGGHTQGSWNYYSDMRFIAPFRKKGTDPLLERLIELAKPIVQRDANQKPGDTAPTTTMKQRITAPTTTMKQRATATATATTTAKQRTTATATTTSKQRTTSTTSTTTQTTPTTSTRSTTTTSATKTLSTTFDIPPLSPDSSNEMCLGVFFDAMHRATRVLPAQLQRRVKKEILQSIHDAEKDVDDVKRVRHI